MTPGITAETSPRKSSCAAHPLVLFNPLSGASNQHANWLQQVLDDGGRVCAVASDDDLTAALTVARSGRFERLIVVGGDGTVSRVIDVLGADAAAYEIAVVPAGTGNDLARSLGVPVGAPEAAWNLALQGVALPADGIALRGTRPGHFVNGITAGFGGRQAADVDPKQKSAWGRVTYWLSALHQMGGMPEYEVVVQADGREHTERCLGFWVMNGRTVGGGFPIAPTALLDDGLADVVLIPALPMLELLAAGVDFSVSGPEQADQVVHLRVPGGTVIADPAIPLSVDGDPEQAKTFAFEVRPQALRLVSSLPEPARVEPAAIPVLA